MSFADTERIANPHNPGSAPRMTDGRLFTEYRGRGAGGPIVQGTDMWAMYEARDNLIRNGEFYRRNDRQMAAWRAERRGAVVDTMVPEAAKRVYTWAGSVEMTAHSIGIGTGRMYLPGQRGLIGGDPDLLAKHTIPWFGNDDINYSGKMSEIRSSVPGNRYSSPYN